MRAHRGFTFVGLLFLLAGAAGIYSIVAFGPAYWDNVEVGKTLHEAANMCMRSPDDRVREFISTKVTEQFDTGIFDERGNKVLWVDFDANQDVRIERTDQPRYVNIWFTYQRHVPLPIIGGERVLTFNDHVEEDLSPVKW
jgi:hypothetical protein